MTQKNDTPPDEARPDELLILALATGATYHEAGARVGVTARTVCRRMADCQFRAYVAEARSALARQASGKLVATMSDAADRLAALLKSEDERIALGACRTVLELAVKLRESAELAAEIEELREMIANRHQQPPDVSLAVPVEERSA